MVRVPVRATPKLSATWNVTVPVPLPLWPEIMPIHGTVETAVQLQAASAVTCTVAFPADDKNDWLLGERLYEHDVTAPSWVTVNVLPPMVRLPLREVLDVFASTVKVTAPLPLPVAPEMIVIQGTMLVAVHAQ